MDKILIVSFFFLALCQSAYSLNKKWKEYRHQSGIRCYNEKEDQGPIPDGGHTFEPAFFCTNRAKRVETLVKVCHRRGDSNIHVAQAICREYDSGDAFAFSVGSMVHPQVTSLPDSPWKTEISLFVFKCGKYFHNASECYMVPSTEPCRQLRVSCWKSHCDNKDNSVFAPSYYDTNVGRRKSNRYGQICHQNGEKCTTQCFRCKDDWNGHHCMSPNSDAAPDVKWEPHFMTMDGKHFDFQGKCSYILLKKAELKVIGKYAVCGKFGVTCLQSLIIETPHTILELGPRKQFFIVGEDDRITTHKPFCNHELCFYEASDLHDAVDLFDQVKIFWDRKAEASFVLDPINMGMVSGLLGNYNGNPDDDFTKPDGTLAKDAVEFGNSWMVEGSCDKTTEKGSGADPKIPKSAREGAEKICKILMSEVFSSCNVSKTTVFNNCILDVATCNQANISDCLCPSFEEYVEECEQANQDIKAWRNHVPQCRDACPPGQEFQSCGNPCESTCEKMKMDRVPCIKACIEGCNCPKGQTKDKDNKCISIASCLGSVEKRDWKRVLVN